MLTTLRSQLNQFAHLLQAGLFPAIEMETGELSETARQLIFTLALLPLHRFVPPAQGWNGRPAKDRLAIARAFREFAHMQFPQFVHEALIHDTRKRRLIGHICRDSTRIEVRERFPETKQQAKLAKQLKKQKAQAQRKQKAKARRDKATVKGPKKKRVSKA